ncbi:hypothetical protein [Lentzea kentuckyensis]|uniref:hypothetical protein n=1 Tax=Lentzea kentuckyensis TaxID=360086 RepID=UPI00117ABE34|nr:hypothetical protein [Lentzea kentuckyensis]
MRVELEPVALLAAWVLPRSSIRRSVKRLSSWSMSTPGRLSELAVTRLSRPVPTLHSWLA